MLSGQIAGKKGRFNNRADVQDTTLTESHPVAGKTMVRTSLPPNARLSSYTAITEFDHAARNGLTANYDVTHAMNVD